VLDDLRGAVWRPHPAAAPDDPLAGTTLVYPRDNESSGWVNSGDVDLVLENVNAVELDDRLAIA
jgi:hypothetical protein